MKYYYIDPSCDVDGNDFNTFITEAKYLARRAAERLQSPSDTDFARVFHILFKMPKTDTTLHTLPDLWHSLNKQDHLDAAQRPKRAVIDQVMYALRDFASDWQQTNNRAQAEIRIYHDDISRWDYDEQEDFSADWTNNVYANGDVTSLPSNVQAFITTDRLEYPPDGWSASVQALQAMINRIGVPGNPSTLNINDQATYMITRLIAHEWFHSTSYGFEDGSDATVCGAATSGWAHMMSEPRDQAWNNAEALALLIIAAGLAELRPYGETRGGFTIDRSVDPANPGADSAAVGGEFVFYRDLTH
ncbi:hypothetical protein V8F20_008567 [Naviculisporaceae sp. PSN 640]